MITVYPVDAVNSQPDYTARQARQTSIAALSALTKQNDPLGTRSGVRPGTSPQSITVSNGQWFCAPINGLLDNQAAAEASVYSFASDAVVSGPLTAADASNPRIDIVFVQISDPAEGDGSSVPGATIGYVAGSPAASPQVPGKPARSTTLAQINVPKANGGSPSVTWVAPYASAAGAPLYFDSQASAGAYQAANQVPKGTLASIMDDTVFNRGIYQMDNGVWSNLTPNHYYLTAMAGNLAAVPPTPPIAFSSVIQVNTNANGDASYYYSTGYFKTCILAAHLDRFSYSNYGAAFHVFAGSQTMQKLDFRVYDAAGNPLKSQSNVPFMLTVWGW